MLLWALLLFVLPVSAQNGINSPYSRYGLGILSDQSNGLLKSMGGIGTGFRMRNTINLKNPASYSSVDTLTFIADLGFSMQNGNYEEDGVRLNARNAQVDYMAMQFRVLPKVGMTVGFMPYANTGYNFSDTRVVRRDEDGEIKSTGIFSGEGGLRQFTGGLGWRPTEWLSVGADMSYLMGDITHKMSSVFSSADVYSRTKTYQTEMKAFKFDFGAQTKFNLKDNVLVLGATWAPAKDLRAETTVADVHTTGDTVSIEKAFSLPQQMAFGMTYSWDNCMVGADVAYQTWSTARFFGESYGADRLQASLGFRLLPDESSKRIMERTSYQGGVNFSQPYFNVGDRKGPLEMGVSAGFSMPITTTYNSMSYIHVTGQFVRIQPQEKGMVCENYFRLSIGVTFMERWFMKWMVE